MNCKKCGKEIEPGSGFCPSCSTKQAARYSHSFIRKGMSEKEFIAQINAWFEENPRVANVSGKFTTRLGFGILANTYKLKSLDIEYELFSSNNKNIYGVHKIKRFNVYKMNLEKLIEGWKNEVSGRSVVTWKGGTNSRGQTGSLLLGGIGARNRMTAFVLYKQPAK